MSVQTQIDRISGAVSAALTALSEKGVTVPAGTKVDGLAALIAAIEAGGGGGGGGVPDGLAAITTGTYTTSQYSAAQPSITHNLGVMPNFFIWIPEEEVDWYDTEVLCYGAILSKNITIHSIGTVGTAIIGYINSSKTMTHSQNWSAVTSYMNETQAKLLSSSSARISPHITYRWYAGVLSNDSNSSSGSGGN